MGSDTGAAEGDAWGQPIVDAFVANGGFSNSNAMEFAHEGFLHLVNKSPSDDAVWGCRTRTLAVWALIGLELGVPRVELEILGHAIDKARDQIPGGRYWLWIGQLAFDLVRYKLNHARGIEHDNPEVVLNTFLAARLDMFATIKDAVEVALYSIENPRNVPPPYKWTTVELREVLFGPGARLSPIGPGVRRFLKHLADEKGIEEGFVFLALAEPKADKSLSWLKMARDAKWWEVQMTASFLIGLFGEDPTSKVDLSLHFRDVKFPVDLDVGDYRFISSLALRAKVLASLGSEPAKSECFWHYSKYVANGETVETAELLSHASELKGQRSTTEIWLHRAQEYVESSRDFYAEEEIEGAFDALIIQTGKLIEVFLKWCLVIWREDAIKLPGDLRDPQWNDKEKAISRNFNSLVGTTLGQGPAAMELVTLLKKAGQPTRLAGAGKAVDNLLMKRRVPGSPRGQKKTSSRKDRLGSKVKFPVLLIANAVAASSNPNHIFRRLPVARLEEVCGAFGGAWDFRPKGAHWQMDRVCQGEALFWAWTVLQTINQVLAIPGHSNSNGTVRC